MSFPTMFGLIGRTWTTRQSVFKSGAWKPTFVTRQDIVAVEGGVASIRTQMLDLKGRPMPGGEILSQFPRTEAILQPFKFWLPETAQIIAERREMTPCPVGAFDCWVTDYSDPALKQSKVTVCASMQFPGLIVREYKTWLSEELDDKTHAVIKTRDMHQLSELTEFSG